jgi:superfamily II DNA or RNA helicase
MQLDMFAPAPSGLYLPEERTPRIVTGSGLKARPYQEEAFAGVRTQLRDNRSTLLVLPTGSGKTFIFSRIAHDWPERDYAQELSQRVLVLAHRDELLQQARQRIAKETGELVGLEQAEARAGLERIVVGSVQTLCQPDRLGGWKPDSFGLVICDEAHHGPSPSYKRIFEHFASAKLLGVTATPDRADEKAMGQVFESVAYVYEIEDAISDAWLVPIRVRQVFIDAIKLAACRTTAGDLNQGDLDAAMAVEEALHGVVNATIEQAGDRKTIVYTTSVDNATRLAEIFNRYQPGTARDVNGKTPMDIRRGILAGFERGDFQRLVNCGIATEGFDCPPVSCIAQARPTKSRSLHAQIVGRGLRTVYAPGFDLETVDGRRQAIAAGPKTDCVAEGQRVLTDHGMVAIEDVTTRMKVWDGVDFVTHDGAILRGESEVITYAGITITPDHMLWTGEAWTEAWKCSEQQIPVSITGHAGLPVREADGYVRRCPADWERQPGVLYDEMLRVWSGETYGPLKPSSWHRGMSQMCKGEASAEVASFPMYCSQAEVLQLSGQALSRLRWKGNPILLRRADGNGEVGPGEPWVEQVTGDRQNRQQQELRAWEYPPVHAPAEHRAHEKANEGGPRPQVQATLPVGEVRGRDPIEDGGHVDLRGDSGKVPVQVKQAKRRVWDILNAGPLHRFTVEGLLVHNCLVLEFTGNSGKHKLASSVDILGGRYDEDEVERAKKIVEAKPGMRADEALAVAHLEAEKRRADEAAKRARLMATTKYSTRDFSPFDVLGIKNTKAQDFGDRFGGAVASDKQIGYMRSMGIDVPKNCTKAQAMRLIGACEARKKAGIANYSQVVKLGRVGIDATKLPWQKAADLCWEVQQNGNRAPSAAVVDRIINS